MAEEYDSLIRRAVPRYEEITATLLQYLPEAVGSGVELGCGTGNLSLRLSARYPGARLTFVDAAPEMTRLTEARLQAAALSGGNRFRFHTGRFEEVETLPDRPELVTSSFSMHHVMDKERLFRAVHVLLQPGGRFCFADQMRAAPEDAHRKNWDHWLAFCRLPDHCTEEEVRSLVAHSEAHDHYVTVGEHVRLLERVGFGEVDCLWRGGMWAIMTATA